MAFSLFAFVFTRSCPVKIFVKKKKDLLRQACEAVDFRVGKYKKTR